jgi:hypothetical protein
VATYTGILPSGSTLNKNDDGLSNSGRYQLRFQDDGNLVFADRDLPPGAPALWDSGTSGRPGQYCILQSDGNLVMVGPFGVVWDLGTSGNPGAYLAVQDDADLVLYQPNPIPVWDKSQGHGFTK